MYYLVWIIRVQHSAGIMITILICSATPRAAACHHQPQHWSRDWAPLRSAPQLCLNSLFAWGILENTRQKYLAFRIPNPGLCCTRLRRPTLRAGPRERGWRTALVSQIRTNVILWAVVGRLELAEKNQFVSPLLYSCNKTTIYYLTIKH